MLLIYHISVTNYVMISINSVCSKEGLVSIYSIDECENAIALIGMNRNVLTVKDPTYPKGCYDNSGEAYFNTHSNDSRHISSSPICRQTG